MFAFLLLFVEAPTSLSRTHLSCAQLRKLFALVKWRMGKSGGYAWLVFLFLFFILFVRLMPNEQKEMEGRHKLNREPSRDMCTKYQGYDEVISIDFLYFLKIYVL